jgi:hypothetical protein
MTQCLRLEKFLAANNQRYFEVSFDYFLVPFLILKLRINARLGGYNSSSETGVLASRQSQPFMIVGMSRYCFS